MLIYSIVFIMRNEAKVLPRLLDSMKPFFDLGGEVIAVDTGSTDDSLEICKRYGVKVFEHGNEFIQHLTLEQQEKFKALVGEEEFFKWQKMYPEFGFFNYRDARNCVMQYAKNDWLLTVDCDEFFLTFDVNYINEWCRSHAPETIATYEFIWRRSANGGETLNATPRIWNRTKSHWDRYVHEIISYRPGVKGKMLRIGKEYAFMEHLQNVASSASHVRKSRMFGLLKDWFDHPDIARTAASLGGDLRWAGLTDAALEVYKQGLINEQWDVQRLTNHNFIGNIYLKKGDEYNALHSWFQGWNEYHNSRSAPMNLAKFYYKKGDAYRAKVWAEIALTVTNKLYGSKDEVENYRHLPHEIMYWALLKMDNLEQAKIHYQKALEYWPTNKKYLNDIRLFRPKSTLQYDIVLVVQNNEKELPPLLKSLQAFLEKGGDIIVVNLGSTDKSVEICQRHGLSVFNHQEFIWNLSTSEKQQLDKLVGKKTANIYTKTHPTLNFPNTKVAYDYAVSYANKDWVFMLNCSDKLTKFDFEYVDQWCLKHSPEDQGQIQIDDEEVTRLWNRTTSRLFGYVDVAVQANVGKTAILLEPEKIAIQSADTLTVSKTDAYISLFGTFKQWLDYPESVDSAKQFACALLTHKLFDEAMSILAEKKSK